ncbi:hypothetical protein KKE60_07700 [Patescibacteria group bacterium]|nr:hypothetical protein [Patescibacteria group bacterium]
MVFITNSVSQPVNVSIGAPIGGYEVKGRIYDTAYGGAGADVFPADLVPTNSPTCFRVIVCIDTATTCIVVRDDGGSEIDCHLNGGNNLAVDSEYAFDCYMTEDEEFNMEFGVACQINYLLVIEIPSLS